MQTTIDTIIAMLKAGMTTGFGPGTGILTNLIGVAVGSPITLAAGVNTVTITTKGTFTIWLPPNKTGTAASGSTDVVDSIVDLVPGIQTIETLSVNPGTITVTLHDDGGDWYVKTWYTHDPLVMPSIEVPAGAVIAGRPNPRRTVFVGEDTVIETIFIRFYQPAYRKSGELSEVAAGMTRLISMFEKAEVLLRTDPTFGSVFVHSDIMDIDPLMVGVLDSNAYRIAQVMLEVTSRAMWGA